MSSASAGPDRRTNEQILEELRNFDGDTNWLQFISFMESLFGEEEWKERNSMRQLHDDSHGG
eukprot:1022712-Prorocentrum_lima.AAC.1